MHIFYQLTTACRQGNLAFIVSTFETKEGIAFCSDHQLIEEAILGNQLDIVQYLLTSKDLPHHCNIHYETDLFLVLACRANRLSIVQYLLTSPQLKEHCNVHTLAGAPIRVACMHGYPQLVDYLIHEHNVQVSPFLYNIVLQQREIEKTKKSINPKSPKNLDDYKHVLNIIDQYQENVLVT